MTTTAQFIADQHSEMIRLSAVLEGLDELNAEKRSPNAVYVMISVAREIAGRIENALDGWPGRD